jgi:hypothetical protein
LDNCIPQGFAFRDATLNTGQHVNFELPTGTADVARMSDAIKGAKQIWQALEMHFYAIEEADGYFAPASVIHRDRQGLNGSSS